MRVDLTYTVRGENPDPDPDPEPEVVAPPTNIVVDNTSNTLNWTNSVGYTAIQHEYCINYSGDRDWRPVTVKPIIIGNVDMSASDIAIRVKAIGINEASAPLVATDDFVSTAKAGPDYFTLTEAENMASHVYYAKNSLNNSEQVASHWESINKILDLKGNVDLTHSGTPTPMLTGRRPIYDDKEFGSISFDNERDCLFAGTVSPSVPVPFEVSLTMINQPGTAWEAWYNSNGVYAGDTGGGIRIISHESHIDGAQAPEKMTIGNLHVRFGETISEAWVNGVYQGSVTNPHEVMLSAVTIGVHSNNAQWEFIARHDFPSLTEGQRSQVFAELSEKFQWGRDKQLPRAENISTTRTGSTFYANYDYVNPLGLPEDTSKTVYRWVWMGIENLADQHVSPVTTPTISLSQIPPEALDLKVEVQVFDIHGNTWKRISAAWDGRPNGAGTGPSE